MYAKNRSASCILRQWRFSGVQQEDGECNLLHNMVLLLIRQRKGSTSCSANSHINVSSTCHHLKTSPGRKQNCKVLLLGHVLSQIVDGSVTILSVCLRNRPSSHKNLNSIICNLPSCLFKPVDLLLFHGTQNEKFIRMIMLLLCI